MTEKSYSKALAGLFGSILLLLWATSFWLQTPDGDLARVGGFPENHFHWKSPQPTFEENLFKVTKHLKDYDRSYDLVVLGDSFSFDQEARRFGWQNFFLARTGLSMLVLDARSYSPWDVVESPAFRKFPPRVFVFQTVERYAQWRTLSFKEPVGVRSSTVDSWNPILPSSPLAVPVAQVPSPSPSRNPEDVLNLAGASLKSHLGLNTRVVEVSLTRGGLFTSERDRTLLVYFDEYLKHRLSAPDFEVMRGGLAALRDQIESNGVTRFVVLIAPDKSSLYAPFIGDAELTTANLIAEAAKDLTLPVLRTDKILGAAIEMGIPDIYLPSDSHWGSMGHLLVADSLADFLGLTDSADDPLE